MACILRMKGARGNRVTADRPIAEVTSQGGCDLRSGRMRGAVSQLPSDEALNIGCVQPGHVDDAAGILLLQQQTNDAAMVAACACRKAMDVMQVVVVPPQFIDDGIGEGCA